MIRLLALEVAAVAVALEVGEAAAVHLSVVHLPAAHLPAAHPLLNHRQSIYPLQLNLLFLVINLLAAENG